MEQWEYLTLFVEASAKQQKIKQFIETTFNKKAKRYSPESMIPELNKLGAEGWEVIHMEPVPYVGRKENIQFDQHSWSNTYFCVCKRRKPGSAAPIYVVHPPQKQQSEDS